MNTPAHLLLGAALFSRRHDRKRTSASVIGALLPDLSLYLLAGASIYIYQITPQRVFNELYYSAPWQRVFAIDNSLVLWGILLAFFLWRRWGAGIALAGAALVHIATDLPLHHDDGRPHFWPLSDWVYESPISYWDSAQHAGWVAPLTLGVSAASAVVLWRRFPAVTGRAAVLALMAAELWVARQWLLFF